MRVAAASSAHRLADASPIPVRSLGRNHQSGKTAPLDCPSSASCFVSVDWLANPIVRSSEALSFDLRAAFLSRSQVIVKKVGRLALIACASESAADKVAQFFGLRRIEHLARALLPDLAAVHEDDFIGDLARKGHF